MTDNTGETIVRGVTKKEYMHAWHVQNYKPHPRQNFWWKGVDQRLAAVIVNDKIRDGKNINNIAKARGVSRYNVSMLLKHWQERDDRDEISSLLSCF